MGDRKLRVLVVGHGAPGGIGRYELSLHAAMEALQLIQPIECHVIYKTAFPGYLSAEANSIPFWHAHNNRIRFLFKLLKEVLTWRPDQVLFTHVNLAAASLVLSLFRPSARYTIITYGIDVRRKLTVARRRALRSASTVIAISASTAADVIKLHGVARSRIVVIPCALHPRQLEPPEQVASFPYPADGVPILLSVARLVTSERFKGIDTVIESLPDVQRAHPGARYIVVGDGDDISRLQGLADRCGVRSSVSFRGMVGEDELARLYRECSVFVLPSRNEGFGIVFLEAMARAKPAIGGNHGGTPEVIVDGKTGLLVEHGDVEQLTRAIISLLDDRHRRDSMGTAGFQRLVEEFSFDRFVERLRAVIVPGGGASMTRAEE